MTKAKPQPAKAQAAKGKPRPKPARLEKLHCMRGTEDEHARIAVEVLGGRVQSFAYYSKKKPRTCSVHVQREDAYSTWSDEGRFTKVTTENGDFLIENRARDVKFLFRDVDRMHYCGMNIGRINGTVTRRKVRTGRSPRPSDASSRRVPRTTRRAWRATSM